MTKPRALKRNLLIAGIAFGVFVLYAPSVRLMLFHDDAPAALWMTGYNPISIFAMRDDIGIADRPMANVLWVLTRELFGWYIPAITHMWNLCAHVLNTVLIAVFAIRLGRLSGLHSPVFPLICALILGLFPFSYQAILWANAFYHPLAAMWGLFMLNAYWFARSRRQARWWLLCVVLLGAAWLSHESGFIFGVLVLGLELLQVLVARQRPSVGAIAVGTLGLIYPLAYRLLLPPVWFDEVVTVESVVSNLIYSMQGFVSWLLILVRAQIGLSDAVDTIILVLFIGSVAAASIWLFRQRKLLVGLFALACWAIATVPLLLLDTSYVRFSPRLLYIGSIGIALFWSIVTVTLLGVIRRPGLRAAFAIALVVLFAWCVPFVVDRQNETARLTPAMKLIDNDLHTASPDATVLLINMPYWSAPAYPAFLIGSEGMPIFQSSDTPAWSWLAATSGTWREMSYVHHDISLTRGDRYFYGIPGKIVDDTALRARILSSNYTYRFDYDSPGLRARRLAIIGTDKTTAPPLAKLADGETSAALREAHAARCADRIALNLTWSDVRNMAQPIGVFVHVFDEQDRQAIVADRDLIDGYLPLDQVLPNVVITETREVTIPANVATVKDIRLGAYLRSDGKRLTATRSDGSAWDGDAIVVPIQPEDEDLCRLLGR
ncbi:MAG: hypothetical protein M1546_03980 [Chloroflexi bacterium]|nr:hypothetical protein [Chloroflexota bacterium]